MKVSRSPSKGSARPAKRAVASPEKVSQGKESPYSLDSISGEPILQRQPLSGDEESPTDICQPIRDAIATDEATIHTIVKGSIVVNPNELEDRKQMLEMCEAVVSGDKEKIAETLAPALDLMPNMGNFMAPSGAGPLLTVGTAHKVFARLMELGLSEEAMSVYQKMDDLERDTFASRERKFWRKKAYFQEYFDQVSAKLAQGDKETAVSDLALIRDALPRIAKGIEGMSWKSIERSYWIEIQSGSFFSSSTRLYEYFTDIWSFITQLTLATQMPFQKGVDHLITQMSAGVDEAPPELNQLGDVLEEIGLVLNGFEQTFGKAIGNATVDLTKTELNGKERQHVDYFDRDDAAHQPIPVNFFDAEKTDGPETKVTIRDMFTARYRQLNFLEKMFTQADNRTALAVLPNGQMKLESVDDWRSFTLARYEALRDEGKSEEEALFGSIKMLQLYMYAFTASTSYNIKDEADPGESLQYLEDSFPRGLTGQLMHDCGVYALRIAYILAGLPASLGLKIRFLLLPAHIALVITRNDLPIMITNNKEMQTISAKEAQEIKDDWSGLDRDGFKGSNTDSNDQFLGELGSSLFLGSVAPSELGNDDYWNTGVNNPYELEDMGALSGTAEEQKEDLLKQWEKVSGISLFNPSKDPVYAQFHLRYLKFIKENIRFYNQNVVPFWNGVCMSFWEEQKAIFDPYQVNAESGKLQVLPKTDADKEAIVNAVADFMDKCDPMYDEVLKALAPLQKQAGEINQLLKDKPGTVASGREIAYGVRASQVVAEEWMRHYTSYRKEVNGLSAGQLVSPKEKISSDFKTFRNTWKYRLAGEPPCTEYRLFVKPVPY